MKKRAPRSSDASEATRKGVKEVPKSVNKEANGSDSGSGFIRVKTVRRSGTVWFTLCLLITYSTYTVYNYQYDSLPPPLSGEQAGKRGFSEVEAMKHVKKLTDLGPHPIASDALDYAFQYVLEAVEKIRTTAHREVDVQVEVFQAKSGANRLVGGLFKGKSLVYSDLSHIVLRIMPKYGFDAGENAILISSHIETVFSTEGAGDCSSCVAVMLELARSISQWAHGFKNSVIFLFNTGEEEGLNGAHSFITQHPFNATIRMAIDLEATGVGGKSSIFQTGSDPWAIENYASVAKYPSGQIIAQELFTSGVIKSATDFQVYKEVAGLSGLDFAYADNTAVYHTKNDKYKFIKPGSLQHLGENLLAFLLRAASLSSLSKGEESAKQEKSSPDPAIYFDILGQYMIVYRYSFAKMFHSSVIMQSLLIWATSLFMGGYPAAVSLALSCLSIILMWIFSISFSVFVAFILPLISSSPVPFAANPWLAFGLFASPAILGAITGQHFGCIILQKVLSKELSKRTQLPPATRRDLVKLESERWLFKGGFIQWLALLMLGTYYEIGSSYVALVWLLPPVFAYGLLEATLTPIRLPKPLKLATLIMSLAVPILVTSGIFIRLSGMLIGMVVRFDRNPGGTPEWLGSVLVAAVIAAFVCLTLVYLLSYLHLSGAKRSIVIVLCILTAVSLALVSSGTVPAFTDDIGRAVNVVHVVDTTNRVGGQKQDHRSFVSLFSYTPGNLEREVEHIKEGFKCGRDTVVDYVLFQAEYGCVTVDDAEIGWSKEDIPTLHVEKDAEEDDGTTRVSIDTKGSIRWALAINFDEVQDFRFHAGLEELVPVDEKSSKDGWHIIQYSGGKKAPTRFSLTLFRRRRTAEQRQVPEQKPLLKLRTDFNRVTPKTERILNNFPSWCSLFGKSTSPLTLAFLADLPL